MSLAFSLGGCANIRITEDNVTKAVSIVEKALREFDRDTLQKYVDSKTLKYIFQFAEKNEQVAEIGRLMFENLEMTVKSVDEENKTVTVEVKNKDLALVGERYSRLLKAKSKGSTVEMLKLFGDEEFLDISVKTLTAQISRATIPDNPTEITLTVKEGKKNLVLYFNEAAEDAVSGGAVNAITNAFQTGSTESTTKE